MDWQKIIYQRKIKYNISNSKNFKVYLLQIIHIFDHLIQINYEFIFIVYILYIYIYIYVHIINLYTYIIYYTYYIYYIYIPFPAALT